MPNLIDITGQRFGRLRVLMRQGRDKHKKPMWLCECSCGEIKTIPSDPLLKGETLSCGCLKIEKLRQRRTKHALSHKCPEYEVWQSMKRRCDLKTNRAWADYGGRGISVCAQWRNSFEQFLADMGQRPTPAHTLDRINNDRDYSPDNCRWATRHVQMNNTRRSRKLTYKGRTQTLIQWARELGVARENIATRLKLGWSVEDTFEKPYRSRGR